MQDKLKMMDAGSVLFKADDLEQATAKVKALMGGELTLDLSSWRYLRIISAQVEETSTAGTFALSLKAGENPRILPIDLPSKELPAKVKEILESLS